MSREAHVRNCEGMRVRIPCATRRVILTKDKAKILTVSLERMLRSMKLTLNEAKTKIVNAERSPFDFLGFSFMKAYSPRIQKKRVIFWPSHQAELSIKRKIREVTNFHRPVKVEKIIEELNPKLRGWINYHRIANASRKFMKIRHYAESRVRKFIRRRGKKEGFGYKDITKDYLYNQLGLFNGYHVKRMKAF